MSLPPEGRAARVPRSAPHVSFLLPVFNGLPTLARALESVIAQTFANWEMIVIDDGSTDGSADCLTAFETIEPRLQVLHRPHQGLVAALNAGLTRTRGEWIARLDADDECLPTRVAEQLRFSDAHPGLGVIGSLVEFGGDRDASPGYAAHVDWLNSVVTAEAIERARFIESPLAHPSVMFRRALVARHGGYRDGPFPEDYELWLRWLEAGVRMAKVPLPLLRWHDSPGRLSRTDPRYAPPAFYRLKATFLARWLKDHAGNPERPLFVWGAGRLTRRRVEFLEAEGRRVEGFIDIDPNKQGRRHDGRPVLAPEAIPHPDRIFVLGYVAVRGARADQRRFLERRGFAEGRDFLFAA